MSFGAFGSRAALWEGKPDQASEVRSCNVARPSRLSASGGSYHRTSGSPVSITETPEFMALRDDCDAYEEFIRPIT